MTRWQRRARLVIARRRAWCSPSWSRSRSSARAAPDPATVGRRDRSRRPSSRAPAVRRCASTATRKRSASSTRSQLTYADGSTKLMGVKVVDRARRRPHVHHHRRTKATVGENESTIAFDGDVALTASDGLTVQDRAGDLHRGRRHRARAGPGRVLARPDERHRHRDAPTTRTRTSLTHPRSGAWSTSPPTSEGARRAWTSPSGTARVRPRGARRALRARRASAARRRR